MTELELLIIHAQGIERETVGYKIDRLHRLVKGDCLETRHAAADKSDVFKLCSAILVVTALCHFSGFFRVAFGVLYNSLKASFAASVKGDLLFVAAILKI